MAESNFYLTQYKEQEFPVFHSQSVKKTVLKVFKQWPKVMKSVTQYLLPEEYYANKAFTPGMDIYRALLDDQGPFLKQYFFNIPLTLTGEAYTYDIIYSHGGEVVRRMQANQQEIEGLLGLKTVSPFYQSQQSLRVLEEFREHYECPLFITRISNDRIGYKTTVITSGEYRDKIKALPKREEQIYQKFIIPYQFKANIIRLHLYTLRSKKQALTNAFKILNRVPIYNQSERSVQPLAFCVNFNKEDSFDTVELKGKPLKSYVDMTQSLVNYLEDYMSICITEVVADYTMDYHKIPWFLSIKSMRYTTKLTKDVKLTPQQLQQLSLSAICKLCGLYYSKQEVSKLVTFKLIYGFLNHLKARGVDSGLMIPKGNPNLQCKICKTCYKIILKEIELYRLSTELAQLQNTIQVVDDITDLRSNVVETRMKNPQYRWRIMIYLNGLRNIELLQEYRDSDLELQLKIFGIKIKVPLTKGQKKVVVGSPFENSMGEEFQYSSYFSKSIGKQSTALNIQSKQYRQGESVPLNYVKTIYFFSKQSDISELLKDEEIVLRITKSKEWNNWISQGNSGILGYLVNSKEEGQIYGSEVYMFLENMKYMKIGLSLGLACDGMFQVPAAEKLRYKEIQVVKGNYYLCQPLPLNWIELFDQQ